MWRTNYQRRGEGVVECDQSSFRSEFDHDRELTLSVGFDVPNNGQAPRQPQGTEPVDMFNVATVNR